MNIDQMRADVEYLDACLRDLHSRAEGRDLTAEEQADFDAGLALRNETKARLDKRAEFDDEIRKLAADPVRNVSGDQTAGETREVNVNRGADDIYSLDHARRLGGANTREGGVALREQARRVIDAMPKHVTPEMRENAERLTEGAGLMAARGQNDDAAKIAEHIIKFGAPDYYRAWSDVVSSNNPTLTAALQDDKSRAALAEGTTTTGGFMLPVIIDPTLLLTNTGVENPFRSLATVVSITTRDWNVITSAGVTAEWMAEAGQANDVSPTIGRTTIQTYRANAYVQASFEMLQDTDMASNLPMFFADARDRLEGAAFATGTGSTQPFGIVTALNLVTASRTAANTNGALGGVDIYNLDSNMGPRFRPNASFVANKSIWNIVRQLGTAVSATFWSDFGGALPPKLIGYPVYESSAMFNAPLSTATASNDNVAILGDFRAGYRIVDRIGMSVAFNPLVVGTSQRPTGEVGWFAMWRVGADAPVPQAFQMLRV